MIRMLTLDRLACLERDQPLQIDDDEENEYDVDLPVRVVDEQYVRNTGIGRFMSQETAHDVFAAIIHLARSVGPLMKTLRAPIISLANLHHFNSHFASSMAAFPAHCQVGLSSYLDPRSLPTLIYLQNARFVLHRHNLSPICPPEMRSVAVDNSVAVARDTAHLLSRTMQQPPSSESESESRSNQHAWRSQFAEMASSSMCTHIWRCTLFLCLRGYYVEAMSCVKVSAAIGEHRAINLACGRHLSFFLRMLVEKIQHSDGGDGSSQLLDDEEMMAYVSGDVQGSAEKNWVWQGSVPESSSNLIEPYPTDTNEFTPSRGFPGMALPRFHDLPTPNLGGLSSDEATSWGDWDQLLWQLQLLAQDNRAPGPSAGFGVGFAGSAAFAAPLLPHPSAPPPVNRPAPLPQRSLPPVNTTTSAPTSRISIASII